MLPALVEVCVWFNLPHKYPHT